MTFVGYFSSLVGVLKKIDLRPVPWRPVLIIDQAGSDSIIRALGDIPSTVVPIRGEAFLLPPAVAFRLAIQMIGRRFSFVLRYFGWGQGSTSSSFQKSYLATYVETLRPNVVMTLIDNMYPFYDLARQFPHTTFIAIQNGYRLSERISQMATPYSPAWLLVMSEYDRQLHIAKGFDPERTLAVGSIRQSLAARESAIDLPKVAICVVSQWRVGMFVDPMPFPRFSKAQDIFHGFAARYAKERGRSLIIAGTTHPEDENAYLYQFYDRDVPIYRRAGGVNVYQAMRSARLILTVNSTAAREALGDGRRFLSCDYPSEEQAFHDAPRLMPLFVVEPTYEEFCRRVDAMWAMSDEVWSKLAAEMAEFTHPVGRPDVCDKIVEFVRRAAAGRV